MKRAAVGLVTKDQDVLVLLRVNGDLTFPGGNVDEGETDEMTVIREIIEETAVQTHVVRKLGEKPHPLKADMIVSFWECARDIGEPVNVEPTKHLYAKWVPISDVKEMLGNKLSPFVRDFLDSVENKSATMTP